MFEELFEDQRTIARHKSAPYQEERRRYLTHCAEQGYAPLSLVSLAEELLWVVRSFEAYPDLRVNPDQIKAAAAKWVHNRWRHGRLRHGKAAYKHFRGTATQWLRFLGRLIPNKAPTRFQALLDDYTRWMDQERGLTSQTVAMECSSIEPFLRWYETKRQSLSEIQAADIDAYMKVCGDKGWARSTMARFATTLRCFFRYASAQGQCPSSMVEAVISPRVYQNESLPQGPTWEEVRRLLASMDTDRPRDIRDRAMAMLFAIYGLRASEVSGLCLEDIHWEQDHIQIARAKRGGMRTYPLIPVVGNAILRYLQQVRVKCPRRELFLTLTIPHRRLARSSLHKVVAPRLQALGVRSPHRGPHCLRHACATHLVSEHFSLKEIGDHLGHHHPSSTRTYAKVDLAGLRQVAAFDLGGLL